MKNKAKLNYVVDIIIGLGFIAAAVSGVVLFFAGEGGFKGGRNPAAAQSILFLTRFAWKDIHNWSGILFLLLSLPRAIQGRRGILCTLRPWEYLQTCHPHEIHGKTGTFQFPSLPQYPPPFPGRDEAHD